MSFTNYREIIAAMQSDINMLKAESDAQKIEESNYGSSTATTRVLSISDREILFDAAPAVFSGNYTGHYTQGQSYPFYSESASGGQRGITVRDNFGVWAYFRVSCAITLNRLKTNKFQISKQRGMIFDNNSRRPLIPAFSPTRVFAAIYCSIKFEYIIL